LKNIVKTYADDIPALRGIEEAALSD